MPETEATTETTEPTTAPDQREADGEQSVEKLLSALQKERETTKNYKQLQREAAELRKFKETQEQARLTEAEKLAAREKAVADQEARITQRLRTSILRDEIGNAITAEKYTLHAPVGDVLRLLDSDAVEWDGETPKNVRQLLRELVKDRPYLASRRTGSADGGAGGQGANTTDMNALIRQAAGRGST